MLIPNRTITLSIAVGSTILVGIQTASWLTPFGPMLSGTVSRVAYIFTAIAWVAHFVMVARDAIVARIDAVERIFTERLLHYEAVGLVEVLSRATTPQQQPAPRSLRLVPRDSVTPLRPTAMPPQRQHGGIADELGS